MSDEIIANNSSENVQDITPEAPREVVFEEAVEAMLFAAGHPISYSVIARVMDMTPLKVKEKIMDYALKYNNCGIPRGVILLTYSDSCQLCTKSEYLYEIRDALGIKKSGTLSTSSLEVLAIVAYNQPVTRAFVDTLRRVDSSYAMNNLLDRGLIVSKGRLDVPGRPMLYGTTSDFLRCFGLNDLSGLPKTSDELVEAFNNAKDSENSKTEENEIIGGEQISADIDSVMPDTDTAPAITDILDIPDEDVQSSSHLEHEPSAEDHAEHQFDETDEPSAEDDITDI
ncbi:MAG: SMC-Scp complex subunit ScpB [Clostridia bacterium]|nr:SMC-Scp complex subunit ScpB [Clostridia bacterium]